MGSVMNDFHPADLTGGEFDFDAVRVVGRIGQDAGDFTISQFTTALVLFLDDGDLHTWRELTSDLT